jgi:hypothetical protein
MLLPTRSLDPFALTLINRMTVRPDRVREDLISDTIKRLKDANIYRELAFLQVYAAHESQAARVDWVRTTAVASVVNSPTFTEDRGYKGDGSSSYVNTNFSPSGVFQRNDASLGVYINQETDGADSAVIDFGQLGATNGNFIGANNASGALRGRLSNNSTHEFTTVYNTRLGLTSFSRLTTGVLRTYRNGVQGHSPASTSANHQSQPMFAGALNNAGTATNHSRQRIALVFAGADLDTNKMRSFYAIFHDYLSAIGAH